MPRYPSFVGPSYTSQSRIADCERSVNWYPERIEAPAGKAQWVLYPTPGFETFATPTAGAGRALFHQNGRTFAVIGSSLVEISPSGLVTVRGSSLNNLDGSPAHIVSNGDAGDQLFISSGSKGYIYNLNTNTLTFAVDNAMQAAYVDGFFLALDTSSSTLKISDLLAGTTWDPSQIQQRNAGADKWAGMVVAHKEIWLFGTQTTEVFYNAGSSPFPFVPNPNVFIEMGILAADSAAVLDNSPIWLGRSSSGAGVVYRANGYTPVRISTHALEYAISQYSTLADAHAWTYENQGHAFYVLTFPTAGATWVYDAATGAWHEWGKWDGSVFGAVAVYGHAYAWDNHLTLDRTTGKVYRMSVDLATETDGVGVRRLRRAPHLSADAARLFFRSLQIDLEAGLGLSSGQGSDPQVMLRWSDDGGQTWGNEHWVSAGMLGQYKARALWHRLGSSRDRVFEVSVSDPTPWRVVDCYLTVEGGRH